MTNTEKDIREILTREFEPQLLEITDESHLHAGHMGAVDGVSTHFRVKIVSEKFEKTPKIKQHKMVYKALEDQLNGDVHALALNTIKKSKWEA